MANIIDNPHPPIRTDTAIDVLTGNTWILKITRERLDDKGKPLYQEGVVSVRYSFGERIKFITATNGPGTIKEMFQRSGAVI
jgi:hypothetical protein